MNKKRKKLLIRILISVALFVICMLLQDQTTPYLLLVSYLIAGGDVLFCAIRNLFRGQVFDEKILMAIATVGAVLLQEFPEAVFVMVFYQVGELFQSYAVEKSRNSIAQLMALAPDSAWIEEQGTLNEVCPEKIEIGQIVVVKPGEKIPVDGVVEFGNSCLDMAALTGEALPRDVAVGDEVISGCINLKGVLKIRASKEFSDSMVSKILELVENAVSTKAKTEQFITRFSRWYTPVVVAFAVFLAMLPPLFGWGALGMWCHRALNFLVVSCPCALVISVPLSFFGGIGKASRQGILIKGSQFVEVLERVTTVVFDKTGTLTKGCFSVVQIKSNDPEETLRLAAIAESASNHPIAQSLRQAYGKEIPTVSQAEELAGFGIKAIIEGKEVLAGNQRLMEQYGIPTQDCEGVGTRVFVAVNGVFYGVILIADQLKEQAVTAVEQLKKQGVSRIMLCTGDEETTTKEIAKCLKIEEMYAQLLPQDKVSLMRGILESEQKGSVLFSGDGINDAPVLALADVGVAMGALGSDAAIEAADVVLMDDNPEKIPQAICIAKKTMGIVRQNIGFALGIKLTVLLLSAFGITGMWEAVFADVGVSVLAICNAMRTLYGKK
ncbi:MAG: cadmium-translocating P-type ATPase [Ruminococcaceae bacterium]|nr:cadmium-translocating P-type ATPase [Oscillospiraceae bacterium]